MDMMEGEANRFLITEGYRSPERQKQIYDSGVRPCAQPGTSYHNYGLAYDWVPLRRAQKAADMWEADWNNGGAYARGGAIAATLRIACITSETGHLQDARYANWREAKLAREAV